ncbi:MAG: hypothetical protein FJW30_15350 [Acidobacteria bacterium]|nr:hypothetical protein [Acidobacteriota bacterium]
MRVLLLTCCLYAQNWPQFRGPDAKGLAENQNLPAKWNPATGENILWKREIPGLGLSSPIVWGGRVYLTTAVSSNPKMIFEAKLIGELDRRQDSAEQEFRVLAVDTKTGRIVWNELAAKAAPRVLRHPHNSYASPTPVTDGKHLIAFFGSEGLYCYNLRGKLLWKKDLGVMDQGAFDLPDYQWGTASSPILWQGKVILQVDMQAGSFLAAFDAATGNELWRTARDSKPSWATPGVIGKQIVTNGVEHVNGYDPLTGKELWKVHGTSMISVPAPFEYNGLAYVFSGYYRNMRRAYALDLKDSGARTVWMLPEAPYLSTPVITDGRIYTVSTRGVLIVYEAATGKTVYQQRLGNGTGASSSLVAADGAVYAINEDGDVYIVKPGPAYEQLAMIPMGEPILTTPAIANGTLYIRGAKTLWAVRRGPKAEKTAGRAATR